MARRSDRDILVDQLIGSLAKSLNDAVAMRDAATSGLKYAELTGRIDTMNTILGFLQAARSSQVAPKKKGKGK